MTSVSSSLKTFVSGDCVNLAVSVAMPFIVIWVPIDPSDEPIASISTTCSIRSNIACLTSVVHITPDDRNIAADDRS